MINVEFPKLYPWQDVVFSDIKKDNGKGKTYVVKARRQCGKSILAITALLLFAFTNNNSIGTLIEPTLNQSRRVFKQLLNAVGGENSPIIKSSNATLLSIVFTNGSEIVFHSAEQGEALRGMTVKNSILIIDEGAFIEQDIYNILYPITDATRSPILIISTPLFESGEFYEKYKLGLGGSDFVQSYDWSEYDTSELLPPEKLEYYRQTMVPLKFRSEILGEFIKEGSYVFGDFTKCYGLGTKPPVYGGIDWSTGNNEKDDYTCLVLMDEDREVVDIKLFRVFDPMELVDNLGEVLNAIPTLTAVQLELNSIGAVYFSALKRKVRNKAILREFNTSNDSKRRIIEQLIEGFGQGNLRIPEDARLTKQLQNYAAEKTPGGKLTYNGANNVNDDCVIALALCYDLANKPVAKPRFGFA